MLKLYHAPGSCSLVPHIALEEAGAEFETVRVNLAQGEQLKPEYLAINRHGRVPALATDHGVITENPAIINLIADLYGAPGSVPKNDIYVKAETNSLLAWCASTIHVTFATIWRGSRFTSDESVWPALQQGGREALARHFDELESLCTGEWLVGGQFTAVDSYALTFLRWAKRVGLDIGKYPGWVALAGRVAARPAVQRVMARDGLSVEEITPD